MQPEPRDIGAPVLRVPFCPPHLAVDRPMAGMCWGQTPEVGELCLAGAGMEGNGTVFQQKPLQGFWLAVHPCNLGHMDRAEQADFLPTIVNLQQPHQLDSGRS